MVQQQTLNYNKMRSEFKRGARQLLSSYLPGHSKASGCLIRLSLEKEDEKLRSIYKDMHEGIITIRRFGKLFNLIKDIFCLNALKEKGVPSKERREVRELVCKLFRAVAISMSGALNREYVKHN